MKKITYRQVGDYNIPNLVMDEQPTQDLGKYGMMRLSYLENHKTVMYQKLMLECTLRKHLVEIDQQAKEVYDNMMRQLLERNPAPDKATDQMGWVAHMEMLSAQADEVAREIVYS